MILFILTELAHILIYLNKTTYQIDRYVVLSLKIYLALIFLSYLFQDNKLIFCFIFLKYISTYFSKLFA